MRAHPRFWPARARTIRGGVATPDRTGPANARTATLAVPLLAAPDRISVGFVKRLIVCCDGTWNQPDHTDQGAAAPTNVAKVGLAVADTDRNDVAQLVHYQAGVGTRPGERLTGGALGAGLSRNVKECYR